MINPAEIDLRSLPSLPLKAKSKLPEVAGIYFAINKDGKVQYIGQTKNLKKRWANHNHLKQLRVMSSVSIAYLTVSDPRLLIPIEEALISWFNPPLNSENPGRFTGEIGLSGSINPISARFPPEVDRILRSLPDRQERIRRYVLEGLKKDGLLGENKQ